MRALLLLAVVACQPHISTRADDPDCRVCAECVQQVIRRGSFKGDECQTECPRKCRIEGE